MALDPTMSLLELTTLLEQEAQAQPARSRVADGDLDWLSDVTLLARRLTGMPAAFVSVLDSRTTHFIAEQGVQLVPQERGATLCDLVATSGRPVVVPDALAEPALAEYPAVQEGLRCYVGVPVAPDPQSPLAFALCVADGTPHDAVDDAVEALQALARVAERALSR